MPEPDSLDPTHALDGWRPPAPASMPELALDALLRPGGSGAFDPTRLLDGWRPPAPAPLDLELKALLRTGAGPDEAKLARLKARGYEMLDVEDIELADPPVRRVVLAAPVLDILPPPLAEVDPAPPAVMTGSETSAAMNAADAIDLALPEEQVWPLFMAEARVVEAEISPEAPLAAAVAEERPAQPAPIGFLNDIELPVVSAPAAVVEVPELDMAALAPAAPEPDSRLLTQWQAQAWTAVARQVAGTSAELSQTPEGPRVQSHAPQWLCAVWPPQLADAPLGRWPELAALVAAETAAKALQQLLDELPDEAPLWSADLQADWDVVAELVLHQDTALRPAQARALRELVDAERRLRLARFDEGYALRGRVARRQA
ncbi:hypothetical protein ACS5PN_11080 [Roseateles sp. NT4]|uniref:hypothetical protein n=1 Tax=Roseateles sp. NT4 TaxID=3453715 RepID=UPI003EE99387